jgi:ADP-ribose pyrophosphatase YjhB (NUDIX family)
MRADSSRCIATAAEPLLHPRVGVAVSVFPRLGHDGPVDVSRILLIKRGKEPGKGLWSLPGGRLELGEPVALCAVRELAEEVLDAETGVGLSAHVADPVCAAYTCTDVLHRDAQANLTFHYTIVHVLAWLPVAARPEYPTRAASAGDTCWLLPRVLCADDADDAGWVSVDAPHTAARDGSSGVYPGHRPMFNGLVGTSADTLGYIPAAPSCLGLDDASGIPPQNGHTLDLTAKEERPAGHAAPGATESNELSLLALEEGGLLVPWTRRVLQLAAANWRLRGFEVTRSL